MKTESTYKGQYSNSKEGHRQVHSDSEGKNFEKPLLEIVSNKPLTKEYLPVRFYEC